MAFCAVIYGFLLRKTCPFTMQYMAFYLDFFRGQEYI